MKLSLRISKCFRQFVSVCKTACLLLAVFFSETTKVSAQEGLFQPFQPELPGLFNESMARRLDSRKDSLEVLKLLRPITSSLSESIVTIFVDGRPVSLGTIVSKDGLAISKASEIQRGELKVRLIDRRLLDAKVVAVHKAEDLALLEFSAQKLTPVQLVRQVPPVGSFLVSAGADGEVLGLGVAGAEVRPVEENGVLGVGFDLQSTEGVRVTGVLAGSGAATAGIQIGDEILAINDTKIIDDITLKNEVKQLYPGDRVQAVVKRGKNKRTVEIEIRDLSIAYESESDARVHGARSGRLAGFDGVMQHDTVLEPDQCGGPVIDLLGQVVGVNIARAGRVCTYLYPTEKLQPVIQTLMTSARAR